MNLTPPQEQAAIKAILRMAKTVERFTRYDAKAACVSSKVPTPSRFIWGRFLHSLHKRGLIRYAGEINDTRWPGTQPFHIETAWTTKAKHSKSHITSFGPASAGHMPKRGEG